MTTKTRPLFEKRHEPLPHLLTDDPLPAAVQQSGLTQFALVNRMVEFLGKGLFLATFSGEIDRFFVNYCT
jgi:hypothetical protein